MLRAWLQLSVFTRISVTTQSLFAWPHIAPPPIRMGLWVAVLNEATAW